VGFTGGSGMSGMWEGDGRTKGRWRDTDVRIEGPAVRALQGAFAESWLEATGAVLGGAAYFPEPVPAAGPERVQIVTSSPAAGHFSMYTLFLLAIEGARRTIHITNPYFVPDDRMEEALLRAVARGVRIVVLLPGETDWNLVRLASRRTLGRLLAVGVEIREYTAALLHAKSMVVDGVWATVGSTNFDNRSFALNAELNAVFYDADIAGRLDRIFMEDLGRARAVSYERWRRRPLWQRLLELLAWPIQPLL
jgi:cardiolipin synthase A/B